ncbi:Rieske (2Fe-2S) protein [Halococcus sp. AFM35]|uniref:Rieske (2Fe-2S) protein n=1 Tax=Halococcus sp. AFM35 TaxID=3421653 RepID=UPI003EBA2676
MASADGTILPADDVPADTTALFTVRELDGEQIHEAVLIDTDDGIEAWLNRCMHFTHIGLDKGSGAEYRDGEIVCTNHGAMFAADTGYCTFGPCEGAYLDSVAVAVEDGQVKLADGRYEFVATGPNEDDGDLTSTSNVEF